MKMDLYHELIKHLNQLVLLYRQLLDVVRKEKQLLLKVDLPLLSESNKNKEQIISQIKALESDWMSVGEQLYIVIGLKAEPPRLSEIARHFSGDEQSKLLQVQSVMNLLIQRTTAANKENEELVRNALTHISGAMKAIRDTLNKNSVYAKKGIKSETPVQTSGRLVSKEV